jgi:membrane associated rhomboid family serine protease
VIPLRDTNPTHTTPVLTYALIAVNTAVFAYQSTLGPGDFEAFVVRHGLVPFAFVEHTSVEALISPLTSMFMHGGWLHLLMNMWTLYIFGDNVEDALGKARFALFYLATGLGAAAAQVLIDTSSEIPMVGASGAVAGVLAAYLKLFPRARVLTVIPLFFVFVQELPAVFFIVLWFVLQLLGGFGSLAVRDVPSGGVAFFAHIGGFVAGLWLVALLRPSRNTTAGFRRAEFR